MPQTVRPVKVTTAAGAAVIDKDFAGLATPDDAVNLAFKLPGQVLDVPVAQGESVKKGALLAELDPRDIELQVSADRSAFEEARSQMQRMQRLLEHEAVSRQEFESAQTRFAQAKSAYENSLDLLKETKLRAPFASVVERKFVDNYERVQAGQSIVRVVNPVTTKVQFTMPESGLSLLSSPSTRFEVEFDNYRGVKFPAVLKDYAKTSSDASGFPVSLRLTDVDTGRYSISPGMSCMVTMQSADPVTDAVSLPVSAVYAPAEGGTYVWVVIGGDRVERRAVTLGELYGRDRVVVDSGVEPGERVVTAGVYQLRQGERVRILNGCDDEPARIFIEEQKSRLVFPFRPAGGRSPGLRYAGQEGGLGIHHQECVAGLLLPGRHAARSRTACDRTDRARGAVDAPRA